MWLTGTKSFLDSQDDEITVVKDKTKLPRVNIDKTEEVRNGDMKEKYETTPINVPFDPTTKKDETTTEKVTTEVPKTSTFSTTTNTPVTTTPATTKTPSTTTKAPTTTAPSTTQKTTTNHVPIDPTTTTTTTEKGPETTTKSSNDPTNGGSHFIRWFFGELTYLIIFIYLIQVQTVTFCFQFISVN